jgi:type I restriction enzyme, S subunit
LVRAGYKITELGETPNDWEVKALGELGEFTKGKGIAKSDISNYGVKCILYGQLYTTYKQRIRKVNTLTNCKINNPTIGQKNDLLIPSSGETAIDIATASALNVDNVYIGGDINLFRPLSEVNSNYLSYQISFLRKNDLAKLAQGSTVYHLYAPSLKKFKVLIPPIKEQQKIVDILSTVDEQLEQTDQLIEKTKELKKGLMQKLLTKGIGHTEFKQSEVGEIPVEWEMVTFKDLSVISQGLQVAISERYKDPNNNRLFYITIQYLNDKENPDNIFYIENPRKSVVCTKEDILMTRTGNTGMVITNTEGVFHNNFFKVDYDKFRLNKVFLVSWLNSFLIQGLIKKYAGTTTIPDLKHSDFYRLPLVVPSLQEQQKIADILSTVDDQIEEYNTKKEKLEILKKGLMQQLLKGKIRLNVLRG